MKIEMFNGDFITDIFNNRLIISINSIYSFRSNYEELNKYIMNMSHNFEKYGKKHYYIFINYEEIINRTDSYKLNGQLISFLYSKFFPSIDYLKPKLNIYILSRKSRNYDKVKNKAIDILRKDLSINHIDKYNIETCKHFTICKRINKDKILRLDLGYNGNYDFIYTNNEGIDIEALSYINDVREGFVNFIKNTVNSDIPKDEIIYNILDHIDRYYKLNAHYSYTSNLDNENGYITKAINHHKYNDTSIAGNLAILTAEDTLRVKELLRMRRIK